jgi:hypothetical protein
MMRLFLCAIALMLMALAPADAAPLGRVTPTSATSACIGTGSSPVCAAETLIACFARADIGLCRRIGVSEPGNEMAAGPRTVEYVIDRQSTIKKEDITDDLRDLDYFKPGYVLLEIRRRDCPSGQTNCEDVAWSDLQVYARPIPTGGWDIAGWRGDSEQESAPEIPENYQPPPKPN